MQWTPPPTQWNELTTAQLIHIFSIENTNVQDPVYRMKVFLYLCGLELCGESFYTRPDGMDEISEQMTMEQIDSELQWMETVLSGEADITVVLRRIDKEDGERFAVSLEHLFRAVTQYTKFLDEPMQMTDNKLGIVEIEERQTDKDGKEIIWLHAYKAPDSLISNLTYGQFQNAQNALSEYWDLSRESVDAINQAKQIEERLNKCQNRDKAEELAKNLGEFQEYIMSLMDKIRDCQAEFLCHVLTSDHPRVESQTVMVKDKLGTVSKQTIETIVHNYVYDETETASFKEELKTAAPPWLFPLLNQNFQASLMAYKKRFSNLFKGGGGGSEDQFKAMLSTLNTLKKEYGYVNQQDVLDTNVPLVFEALDSMARQAKELSKVSSKHTK